VKTIEPLTTSRIASAKAINKELWLSDSDGKRGFGRLMLRVSPNGSKHFYFRICTAGSRQVVPIGPYSKDSKPNHFTLNQAREAAQQVLTDLRAALHQQPEPPAPGAVPSKAPRPETVVSKQPEALPSQEGRAPAPGEGTLDDLCAAYVQQLQRDKKISATESEGRFKLHLYDTPLGKTLASQVTSKTIAAHLRSMVEANKGRTAALLRSTIGTAYALALRSENDPAISGDYSRFQIVMNPVLQTGSMSKFSKARRRTLSPYELQLLWSILESAVKDTKQVLITDRFLRVTILLGGQRCQQLARVSIADVDQDNWTIQMLDPKGRRTDAREHLVPISTFAQADIRWLLGHARDVGANFLFPGKADSNKPIMKHSPIDRVQKLSSKLLKEHNIPAFSYSDFRRTTQTQMAALGIPEEVANQILSHGLGGVVKRHYNKHSYEKEKREALEKWGAYLVSLKPAHSRA